MASDPVSICFEDPTFNNLLRSTPSVSTRTLFAVFRLITEGFHISLFVTIFVAIHALVVLLSAYKLVDYALAAVCTLLADLMVNYG